MLSARFPTLSFCTCTHIITASSVNRAHPGRPSRRELWLPRLSGYVSGEPEFGSQGLRRSRPSHGPGMSSALASEIVCKAALIAPKVRNLRAPLESRVETAAAQPCGGSLLAACNWSGFITRSTLHFTDLPRPVSITTAAGSGAARGMSHHLTPCRA